MKYFVTMAIACCCCLWLPAQDIYRWDKTAARDTSDNIEWFKNAKFGLFIHWGLYSQLAGTYKGQDFFGSGEWLMYRQKIPAADYAKTARDFNPVDFNAEEWAKFAKAAGFRYVVITAKHHEGFSMFDSKVSDFNIVKATPYGKDPMKPLAEAMRKEGLRFGFYYSQYLDWHERNGGGNTWDFDETKKDYTQYYREKSIPQLKELLTNYGPLGILWFDMPGGQDKEQTRQMVDSLKKLQPHVLFSSRIGNGMGDYIDFGDSEVPPMPILQPWEAICTHNDSWGFIRHDMNFKTPRQMIRLLANVASKGGNLMVNVGPDGTGKIPAYSIKYLEETGRWLARFGQSIYGSTYGLVPAQPWGVTTSKPGKLFLLVEERPANGQLLLPGMGGTGKAGDAGGNDVVIRKVYQLDTKKAIVWHQSGKDIILDLPPLTDDRCTVFVVEYRGTPEKFDLSTPVTVSPQYPFNEAAAIHATLTGATQRESITSSYYFGDWKTNVCLTHQAGPGDKADFALRVTDPGDYKIILEYACPEENSGQEGVVELDGQSYFFSTLRSSSYNVNEPLLFIRHEVATVTIDKPGIFHLTVHPLKQGRDLFYLKSAILETVR